MLRSFTVWFVSILSCLLLIGCGGGSAPKGAAASASGEDKADPEVNEHTKPEEMKFIEAAKPFIAAVAARKYDDAYGQLSSHARMRMSLNQFKPDSDDKKFAMNENNPMTGVASAKFVELMKLVEKEHGQPLKIRNLHVHTLDPKVLAGGGNSPEDQLDAMFAIGAMPKSIPANIRKASIRGQIRTELSDAQLAEAAAHHKMSVEELKKSDDFSPYFTVKVVLVEEDGLKVGYFEFLPPSMLD